jgi:hypothetical protein
MVVGIDIAKYENDIKKILYKRFGQMIAKNNLDPQDILQEVLKGIHARNQGKCPWDANKSTAGSYIYMVCRGIVLNQIRDLKSNPLHNNTENLDSLDIDPTYIEEGFSDIGNLKEILERGSELDKLSAKMMPLFYKGSNQKEIMEDLNISKDIFKRGHENLKKKISALI